MNNIIEVTKPAKERNFSFKDKNTEEYDNIEIDGENLVIPHAIGSTFWAITKVFYHHIDEPMSYQELVHEVDELMSDRDENAWNKYKNKEQTTTYKRLTGTIEVKPASSWQDRIIGNTRTLTRISGKSPYGKRLMEQGFKLQHKAQKGKNFFILTRI